MRKSTWVFVILWALATGWFVVMTLRLKAKDQLHFDSPIVVKELKTGPLITEHGAGWQIWKEDGKWHKCGVWQDSEESSVKGWSPVRWYGRCDSDPEGCTTFVDKDGNASYLERNCKP